jgi:hypothetical protein
MRRSSPCEDEPQDRRQGAAALAEMSLDEFRYLNPQHNRPVIAGADEHTILLPIDKAEVFAAKLDLVDQPLVSWQAYRMKNGETLQHDRGEVRASSRRTAAPSMASARMRECPAGTRCLFPRRAGRTSRRRR